MNEVKAMNMTLLKLPTLHKVEVVNWRMDMIILLSRGVSVVEACETLDVPRSTFYRHLNSDPTFKHQVERAKTLVSIELFQIIRDAKEWRAAAWLLEKRFPTEYGTARQRLKYAGCTCGAASKIIRSR
ncbi:MAG: hypothetical protein CL916_04830 [Deltaproteobacteria bacterium]|nr:hypothetical protein [Deltaproteobacteria bacterium]